MFRLKPALFALPICVICFLISVISVFAEDSLTITTYYPSPYGVYNELRLYPHSPATTACDSTQEGNTYYDLNAHNLYVCRYNGTTYAWESGGGGGYWAASGNDIYNTNTGNVGIGTGTTAPVAKLEVVGSSDTTQLTVQASFAQTNANPLIKLLDQTGQTLMDVNSDSISNVFIGASAGRTNIINLSSGEGLHNIFIGYTAGYSNTNGYSNTIIGSQAFYLNSTGNNNTANGSQALQINSTGSGNTANGSQALLNNSTGDSNTANGSMALRSNSTGYFNTANGATALCSNTTGINNTANGVGALYFNTIGNYNTANGVDALNRNTTGSNNTANGVDALNRNTTGNYNTANGSHALENNTISSNNTAIGYQAIFSGSGSGNTAIGYQALFTSSNNYNTAVGYAADVTGNFNNTIAIGYNAKVNASNKAVIGNSSVTTIGGYGNWSNYSDARLKENIYYKNDLGLDFIMDLKTASFNYKKDVNKVRRDGLIAQDVQATLAKLGVQWSGLTIDDDEQKTLNLSYEKLTIPLINAVQELKVESDKLRTDNDELRSRLDKLETKIK